VYWIVDLYMPVNHKSTESFKAELRAGSEDEASRIACEMARRMGSSHQFLAEDRGQFGMDFRRPGRTHDRVRQCVLGE
jgi:hypothetical protein